MAIRWACLLACQSFFDVSGVVGSGEEWSKVDGGGWRQWMRVVMWLMAVVDGHQKCHGRDPSEWALSDADRQILWNLCEIVIIHPDPCGI